MKSLSEIFISTNGAWTILGLVFVVVLMGVAWYTPLIYKSIKDSRKQSNVNKIV